MDTTADVEIRFVGELQRLEVKPGDRFVLTSDRHITLEMAERLKQSLSQVLGGAPVLVLSDGLKLGVVSGADLSSEGSQQAETE